MGVLKQTLNSLHVAINMAGPSKKSSKKKSKTSLKGRRDSAALPLDDDEKADKAADKERKNQANIKRNAKLAQILARKLDPNAVSPETTAEIPKEVAEKLKIKALKEEQANKRPNNLNWRRRRLKYAIKNLSEKHKKLRLKGEHSSMSKRRGKRRRKTVKKWRLKTLRNYLFLKNWGWQMKWFSRK